MTEFDNTTAIEEGWSIFQCYTTDGVRWRLQKCGDSNLFNTDEEAWHHVVAYANAGSPYHRAALLFLATHNPMETSAIQRYTSLGVARR